MFSIYQTYHTDQTINWFSRFIQCGLSFLLTLQLSACSSVFFYPDKQLVRTPTELGLAYEEVYLSSGDGTKLHGWWLTTKREPKGTVYFLHGNAENISTHISSVHWLPEQSYQVFLLDYRGYGQSEGQPTVPDVLQDIHAGLGWLVKNRKLADKPLFLLGQSLGASLGLYFAATDTLAKQHLSAVISDAAFTGYAAMARQVVCQSWVTCWLSPVVSMSMIAGYDPLDTVSDITPLPLLMIHSQNDAIVPYAFGRQLFQTAANPKQFISTQGAHITTFNHSDYRQAVLNFMLTINTVSLKLKNKTVSFNTVSD